MFSAPFHGISRRPCLLGRNSWWAQVPLPGEPGPQGWARVAQSVAIPVVCVSGAAPASPLMTHFVFHPQQNPFASPPSRQRKMCFFCHPVGRFLLLSPAEVEDSGSRDGRHSPRANIPWEGAGKREMAKLVFAVAEVGRTLFFPFFFFHCTHAPVGDSRQRCVLRSRFSMLLPACSSASHMYAETRKACMQNADGAASLS